MKNLIGKFLVLTVLAGSSLPEAYAQANELTAQQIRQRLTVTSEVFVFDGSGKTLLAKLPETKVIEAAIGGSSEPLSDRWASRSGLFQGLLAMKTTWSVSSEGEIKVAITEYGSDSEQPRKDENRYARELKTETRSVEMMESVNWVSVNNHGGNKIVVRYTPNLREDFAEEMNIVRVAARNATIVDNTGSLWADHLTFDGKFVGVTTHRGTLLLSFYKFAGAREIGLASGNRIEASIGKNTVVSVISNADFLPGSSSGKIYGLYMPERKSEGLTSNHLNTSNQESEFLKRYR